MVVSVQKFICVLKTFEQNYINVICMRDTSKRWRFSFFNLNGKHSKYVVKTLTDTLKIWHFSVISKDIYFVTEPIKKV